MSGWRYYNKRTEMKVRERVNKNLVFLRTCSAIRSGDAPCIAVVCRAPRRSSVSTQPRWPFSTAACRAVAPLPTLVFTGAYETRSGPACEGDWGGR